MANPQTLLHNILTDMKVELAEMFDQSFERKGFFGDEWAERKNSKAKGSLLLVTGKLRRSVRSSVSGNSVKFRSSLPYADIHNRGGKFTQHVGAHTKKIKKGKNKGKTYSVKAHSRTLNMPQRQFVGDHPEVQQAVKQIIQENVADFFNELARELKK